MIPAIVLVQAAFAAQVELALDTADLREGQTVGLSLVVHDAEARGVPKLTLPDGLSASFESQSQQNIIVNFKASRSVTYRYALTALKAGDYTLGPLTIDTSAGPLTVPATPVKVGAREASGAGLDQVLADYAEGAVYVGQIVMVHLRFATDKTLVNGGWSPPQPNGFTPDPNVDPLTTTAHLQQDGKPLTASDFYLALRASKPGKQVIPGGVLQAQFAVSRRRHQDPFGGGLPLFSDIAGFTDVRTDVFSAPPHEVDVKPVPEQGRPATYTGLVGQFTIQVDPSSTDVGVGQTVTLDVTVAGNGALAGVNLPPLSGDGFTVYDDKPDVKTQLTDGKYAATATFKRAIVPDRPGDLALPPVELSWFDPAAGSFRTERSAPLTLHVTGTASSTQISSYAGNNPTPKPVDALGEDILPIRATATVGAPLPGTWALGFLVPGLGLLAAQLAPLVKLPRRAAPVDRRVRWEELPTAPEARSAALDRIFREEAARRLGMSAEALHREDAAKLGADADGIYKELEALRYGGRGTAPEARIRAFVEGG